MRVSITLTAMLCIVAVIGLAELIDNPLFGQ